MNGVLEKLASQYQQLYLSPGDEAQYREVVLKGKEPDKKDLSHFKTHPCDAMTWEETPAGRVRIVYLYERQDFELFLQIMAKKCQSIAIPSTQGAAIIDGVVDWEKIHTHRRNCVLRSLSTGVALDWKEEFRRFTMNKGNYTDALIVLSHGPYSNVAAEEVGIQEREWVSKSLDIRKYHECTHFICRRLYPQKIDAVWDEIVADAVGIRAAFGAYSTCLAERLLGIKEGVYIGGRLENYVTTVNELPERTDYCSKMIRLIQELSETQIFSSPFQFAITIEEKKEQWERAF